MVYITLLHTGINVCRKDLEQAGPNGNILKYGAVIGCRLEKRSVVVDVFDVKVDEDITELSRSAVIFSPDSQCIQPVL